MKSFVQDNQPTDLDQAVMLLLGYLAIEDLVQSADIILGLGSDSKEVAQHAALLYHQSFAPLIIFSGGRGRLTGKLAGTEAGFLKKTAMESGVPEHAILAEETSTNTLENIRHSRQILMARNTALSSVIIVTQPALQRRGWATAIRQWSGVTFLNSPPPWRESFQHKESLDVIRIGHLAVGEIDRLVRYASKGDIEPQEITREAWGAYKVARHILAQ